MSDMESTSSSEPVFIDVALVDGPVTYEPIERFPQHGGAESVFLGRTRAERNEASGELARLEYEAYAPMALNTMRDLVDDAVSRFGLRAVRLHHALGPVAVGDASVLVQVAAPHRDRAFEGCRFLIDRLKRDVPIWKREIWTTRPMDRIDQTARVTSTWSPASRPGIGAPACGEAGSR